MDSADQLVNSESKDYRPKHKKDRRKYPGPENSISGSTGLKGMPLPRDARYKKNTDNNHGNRDHYAGYVVSGGVTREQEQRIRHYRILV